jgi:hypothetical protein
MIVFCFVRRRIGCTLQYEKDGTEAIYHKFHLGAAPDIFAAKTGTSAH